LRRRRDLSICAELRTEGIRHTRKPQRGIVVVWPMRTNPPEIQQRRSGQKGSARGEARRALPRGWRGAKAPDGVFRNCNCLKRILKLDVKFRSESVFCFELDFFCKGAKRSFQNREGKKHGGPGTVGRAHRIKRCKPSQTTMEDRKGQQRRIGLDIIQMFGW